MQVLPPFRAKTASQRGAGEASGGFGHLPIGPKGGSFGPGPVMGPAALKTTSIGTAPNG